MFWKKKNIKKTLTSGNGYSYQEFREHLDKELIRQTGTNRYLYDTLFSFFEKEARLQPDNNSDTSYKHYGGMKIESDHKLANFFSFEGKHTPQPRTIVSLKYNVEINSVNNFIITNAYVIGDCPHIELVNGLRHYDKEDYNIPDTTKEINIVVQEILTSLNIKVTSENTGSLDEYMDEEKAGHFVDKLVELIDFDDDILKDRYADLIFYDSMTYEELIRRIKSNLTNDYVDSVRKR